MRLGILSDIHEDVHNLERALSLLGKHQCETLVCLGDVVGFTIPFYRYISTRDAEACIRLVRENCAVVVAGNHDLYAVRRVPRFMAGFPYSDDWYALDYETRAQGQESHLAVRR